MTPQVSALLPNIFILHNPARLYHNSPPYCGVHPIIDAVELPYYLQINYYLSLQLNNIYKLLILPKQRSTANIFNMMKFLINIKMSNLMTELLLISLNYNKLQLINRQQTETLRIAPNNNQSIRMKYPPTTNAII